MCPNFWCFLLPIWMVLHISYGQIQSGVVYGGGCSTCPLSQNVGYDYRGYSMYPQYGQPYYQYPETSYYSQNFQQLPYVYASNQQQPVSNQQIITSGSTSTGTSGSSVVDKNTYSNVKTEIIDIDPKYFRYLYSNYFPRNVGSASSYTTRKVVGQQVPYVVKVDSQQHNNTNIPQVIKKHDVQHKTFTFKKTFVLNPDENKNNVINLNFVNGVPVTTEVSENLREETTIKPQVIDEVPATTEQQITTTDSEIPVSVNSWFI